MCCSLSCQCAVLKFAKQLLSLLFRFGLAAHWWPLRTRHDGERVRYYLRVITSGAVSCSNAINVQVFGARGVHSGAPIACPYLPAAFVGLPTALPASVQLQLCLARLRNFASFDTIVAAGVQHPVPPDTESKCNAAVRVTAAGKLGLCRGPALAHAGHASHVTQLLHDPMDPARIAFALACGAAGVLRSDTGRVTHTFNPAPLRPRNEGVTASPCICPRAKATLAWSADGRILYKLLDQHTVADPIDASNMAAAGGGGALRAERRGHKDDGDVIAEKMGEAGWLAGALIDDIGRPMPGRKAVYALDVTPTSALRCSHGSHGSVADAHSDASLPFCLDWQVCDTARGNGACGAGRRLQACARAIRSRCD